VLTFYCPEQRKATLRRVEMELDEADEMVSSAWLIHYRLYWPVDHQVSQMEVEIQGVPQSIKPKYQSKVKASKAELVKLKKQAVSDASFTTVLHIWHIEFNRKISTCPHHVPSCFHHPPIRPEQTIPSRPILTFNSSVHAYWRGPRRYQIVRDVWRIATELH
jgi:hypothetical protein